MLMTMSRLSQRSLALTVCLNTKQSRAY